MLPQFVIDKIESLQKLKVSMYLAKISEKVFAALKSDKFNPNIAPYFEKINRSGPPFTNYDLDPDNVSQIKKLLNALFHAHLTFKYIENLDPKKILNWEELKTIYYQKIDVAYEACFLATHLDIDIQEMFQEEFNLLLPLVSRLQTVAEENEEQTKQLARKLQDYPLAYKVGEVTGIALEQIHPSDGQLDYDFLTQFSAVLPSYIDKITAYIKQYSSQLIEEEPGLNREKLQELENTALKLLNDLENLKGGSFFISLKFLNYIHIIRHILTLSTSSLEQMGHLSDSSQDLIRDNLTQLKYYVLPELFGLVDKIEVNFMLKPGTLSIALMEKIKPLYQTLIYYASKPVNFKEKGEELLSIEDSRFLTLRLERTYQRIDKANKALFKIDKTQQAFQQFYKLLSEPQYVKQCLHELPEDTRNNLMRAYKVIKPYMAKIDPALNEVIITGLLGKTSWASFLGSPWHWWNNTPKEDQVEHLLSKKEALANLLIKKKATQQFHIGVNTQLLESVQKETNLTLFPYSDNASFITIDEPEKADVLLLKENEAELYNVNEAQILSIPQEQYGLILFSKTAQDTIVTRPENLNAEQSLTLYQWYRKKQKHFAVALKAYNEFNALVTYQLNQNTKIPSHVFNFNHLEPSILQKGRKLYNQFRPYFLAGASEDLKGLVSVYDAFFNPIPGSQGLTHAVIPVLIEFELLHHYFKTLFAKSEVKWNQKAKLYLKLTKHNYAGEDLDVFRIDEARGLRAHNAYTPNLKFIKTAREKLVSNQHELTADQALCLYQWYKNKLNKFNVAREAYNAFISLLHEQAKKTSIIKGTKLALHHLDQEAKLECRKLYNLFQPYFINGVSEDIREQALALDKFLVHAFAEESTNASMQTIDLFTNLDKYFQEHFSEIHLEWTIRSGTYLKKARVQYDIESEAEPFGPEPQSDRANFLIKHTHYSAFILECRKAFEQIIPLFNKSMQQELAIKPQGIPFPELQDKQSTERQSSQVLAVKQLYNSFYHIEHVVRKLELLNDKSRKTQYVLHLVNAYTDHIDELITHSKSLLQDKYFGLIGREVLEKAQNLWALTQENIAAYQIGPDEVLTGGKVKFNALWYTLNAFYVIPKHIRSLRNKTYLTIEELDALHCSAKNANLIIERIIESSNSYFKLFLQTPGMLHLYRELKSNLTEFISTAHSAFMDNLDSFNEKVFTPMLVEADRFEDRLGLAPGTFSGPLRQITHEYYKGLLHPLKLDSKRHIELICDKTTTQQRLAATQRIIDAPEKIVYERTNALYQLVFSSSHITDAVLIKTFKEALPELMKLKRILKFTPAARISPADKSFDTKLNASLNDYDPKLTDIKGLIKAGYNHYVALKNTYAMRVNSAKEKFAYLTQLNMQQDQENSQFIQEYTSKSFDRQLEIMANWHVGLQFTAGEYAPKLQAYLLTFRAQIIQEAKTAEDINLKIKTLLVEKITLFQKNNIIKYHHLEAIMAALNRFKNYFTTSASAIGKQNSLFEHDQSLAEKSAEINKLVAIAQNDRLQIDDRILQIKHQVLDNPGFSRIILKAKDLDHFSFAYFRWCILRLLEAIHLYTPEKDAHLIDLKHAANHSPTLTDLTKRFGLFASRPALDDMSVVEIAEPAIGTSALA
jgi:hypothetical protein